MVAQSPLEIASPCWRRRRWTSWRCPRGFARTANVGFPARAQHNESFSARISVRIHASTRNTSNTIHNMSNTNNTNSVEQPARPVQSNCVCLRSISCARLTHSAAYLLQLVQISKTLGANSFTTCANVWTVQVVQLQIDGSGRGNKVYKASVRSKGNPGCSVRMTIGRMTRNRTWCQYEEPSLWFKHHWFSGSGEIDNSCLLLFCLFSCRFDFAYEWWSIHLFSTIFLPQL